jgi:hypothetical protein
MIVFMHFRNVSVEEVANTDVFSMVVRPRFDPHFVRVPYVNGKQKFARLTGVPVTPKAMTGLDATKPHIKPDISRFSRVGMWANTDRPSLFARGTIIGIRRNCKDEN